jgi:hypothetical protein
MHLHRSRRLRARQRPKRLTIFKKSEHMQRWLLRNPWIRPLSVFNFATVVIQKFVRGYLVRAKQAAGLLVPAWKAAAPANNKRSQTQKIKRGPTQLDKYLNYIDRFNNDLTHSNTRKPHWLDKGFSVWCAVRIQTIVRMVKPRRRFLRQASLINHVAAIVIQTNLRNLVSARMVSEHMAMRGSVAFVPQGRRAVLSFFMAARMIQLAWRGYCNRRIYHYFRDIIKVRGTVFPISPVCCVCYLVCGCVLCVECRFVLWLHCEVALNSQRLQSFCAVAIARRLCIDQVATATQVQSDCVAIANRLRSTRGDGVLISKVIAKRLRNDRESFVRRLQSRCTVIAQIVYRSSSGCDLTSTRLRGDCAGIA